MSVLLKLREPALSEGRHVDCIEIYLPKRLKHLSELYGFLRSKVSKRLGDIVLDGFSIYEADGAFYGKERVWEERTLVVRIFLIRLVGAPRVEQTVPLSVQAKINDLGRELADRVAIDEEEIWICTYPQYVTVFYPRTIIK